MKVNNQLENRIKELKESGLDNLTEKIVPELLRKQDTEFTKILRNFANPPIKGEITIGKIKWRGIRICTQMTYPTFYTWLEQRGSQIGPKIQITALRDF